MLARLAFDVPQSLVQPAHRIVQYRPVAPVGACVGVLPQILDVIDVPAFSERVQVLVHRHCDRERPLIECCTAQAVKTRLARLDLHHAKRIPAGAVRIALTLVIFSGGNPFVAFEYTSATASFFDL